VFLTSPISASLLFLTTLLVLVPWFYRIARERRGRSAT